MLRIMRDRCRAAAARIGSRRRRCRASARRSRIGAGRPPRRSRIAKLVDDRAERAAWDEKARRSFAGSLGSDAWIASNHSPMDLRAISPKWRPAHRPIFEGDDPPTPADIELAIALISRVDPESAAWYGCPQTLAGCASA